MNRKDLQASTLVGLTRENPILDTSTTNFLFMNPMNDWNLNGYHAYFYVMVFN